MRFALFAALAVAIGACGALAAAQPAAGETAAPAPLTAADRLAILRTLGLRPDARGQVVNACEEKVPPKFLPANLGGAVGVAQLVIVEGGPNTVSCYGDVPGAMNLMKREGAGWRSIFADRGYIAIMTAAHGGVHDIALGGPGFSFPVFQWNGTAYVPANRKISDTEYARYPSLP